MQGVHKLDCFPHCVDADTAIEEQTVRCLHWTKLFSQKKVFDSFPNLCCPKRWSGMNRISHPDWVKLCVDPNGRIKLRAKQKYKIPVSSFIAVSSSVFYYHLTAVFFLSRSYLELKALMLIFIFLLFEDGHFLCV